MPSSSNQRCSWQRWMTWPASDVKRIGLWRQFYLMIRVGIVFTVSLHLLWKESWDSAGPIPILLLFIFGVFSCCHWSWIRCQSGSQVHRFPIHWCRFCCSLLFRWDQQGIGSISVQVKVLATYLVLRLDEMRITLQPSICLLIQCMCSMDIFKSLSILAFDLFLMLFLQNA